MPTTRRASRNCSSTWQRFQSIGGSSFCGKLQLQSSLFAPKTPREAVIKEHVQYYTYLDVDFVTAENDGDVLTNALEIAMPVGDVLVGDTGCHVEHDNTTLALDIISVTETTELLLSSSIPDVEADSSEVGRER